MAAFVSTLILVHGHTDADDLRNHAAREFRAQPAAFAGGIPRPEDKRGRRKLIDRAGVLGLGLDKPFAGLGLLEADAFEFRIPDDGVEHAVRRIPMS